MKLSKKAHSTKAYRVLEAIIMYSFIIFVLCIFASKTFFQFQLLPNIIAYVTVVVSVVVVILLFRFSDVIIDKTNRIFDIIRKTSYFKLFLLFVVISLTTRILFVFLLKIHSMNDNSDMSVYATTSYELAKYGKVVTKIEYCNYAPYSFWQAVFFLPVSLIFGKFQIAYSVYFAIILTIAYSFLFDTVSYVFSKAKAFVIFILIAISPVQVLLPQYINHEHTFLFLLAISAWLYFRVIPSIKNQIIKILLCFCFFIVLALCKAISSGALLLLLVYLLVFVFSAVRKNSLQEWIFCGVKIVSLILVLFIIGNALTAIKSNFCDPTKTRKTSGGFSWTFYVGANYETSGEYTEEDANTWFEDERAQNPATEKEYHNKLLSERYENLFSNPSKFIKHYVNKFNIIWQQLWTPIARATGLMTDSSTKELFDRYLYTPFMYIEYGISYFVSIILLWSVWKFRKCAKSMFYVFMQLFIMGYTFMLFLSELGWRYNFPIIPFFYIAAFALINTQQMNHCKKKLKNQG